MTVLIAKIIGPYLLITAAGFGLSRSFYERMVTGNANADPILLNLSGAVHFVFGVLLLISHFVWVSIASVAVSLFGVALIAKGAVLIIAPEMALKAPKTVGRTLNFSMIGFAVAGAYFTYVGYFGAT